MSRHKLICPSCVHYSNSIFDEARCTNPIYTVPDRHTDLPRARITVAVWMECRGAWFIRAPQLPVIEKIKKWLKAA